VALDLAIGGVAADSELRGDVSHHPVILLDDPQQCLALSRVQRNVLIRRCAGFLQIRAGLPDLRRQITQADNLLFADGERGSDRVSQLADIAGPGVEANRSSMCAVS
jgi:hypothetical protein